MDYQDSGNGARSKGNHNRGNTCWHRPSVGTHKKNNARRQYSKCRQLNKIKKARKLKKVRPPDVRPRPLNT